MFRSYAKYHGTSLKTLLDDLTDNEELKAVLSYCWGDYGKACVTVNLFNCVKNSFDRNLPCKNSMSTFTFLSITHTYKHDFCQLQKIKRWKLIYLNIICILFLHLYV